MKKTLKFNKDVTDESAALKGRMKTAKFSQSSKRLKIGNSISVVVTVKDAAYILSRSRSTLLRWEKEGVFPSAPLRIGTFRYYRIEFCEKLYSIIEKFKNNTKIPADKVVEINKLFSEERDFLKSNTISYASKKSSR